MSWKKLRNIEHGFVYISESPDVDKDTITLKNLSEEEVLNHIIKSKFDNDFNLFLRFLSEEYVEWFDAE